MDWKIYAECKKEQVLAGVTHNVQYLPGNADLLMLVEKKLSTDVWNVLVGFISAMKSVKGI